MEKKHQWNLGYLLVAVWMLLLIQALFSHTSSQARITYKQLIEYLEQDRVESVTVDDRYIRGTFISPVDSKTHFITPKLDTAIAETLGRYDVDYTGVVTDNFLTTLLSWIAPALVFFLVWFLLFRKFADRQGMGGMMPVGKSKAKVYVQKDTGVNFNDVAGVDEAKEELLEVVRFLQNPQHYGRLGAHIPKGVLLVGPPGTGKTLLAKAVAGEAGVPFFSISGSEFIEMFVGVGAARVRDLFEQAKKQSPAIIFIDELDALGRVRGPSGISGGHDEREQTLNQLLTELDGFDPAEGVIILAATNRPEILDPALLRAGRFDRQVLVDRPDKKGRIHILNVHIKKVLIDDSVDVEQVAALTTGFSGADLANLVNEAALLATRKNADKVTLDDFVNAIERIIAGLEKKNRLINDNERRVVAHHELGHAIVAMALNPQDPVQKISIIPRGIGALGYTIQRPTEDRYLISKTELKNRISVLLGGRAAEHLFFEDITTGAADDLAKATDIAKAMVTKYGMSDTIGMLSLQQQESMFLGQNGNSATGFGPAMEQAVTESVQGFIAEAFANAERILEQNRALLEKSAKLLIKYETLVETDLQKIKEQVRTSL